MPASGIINGGRRQLLDSPEVLQRRQEVEHEVREGYRDDLARSGWLRRAWIRHLIRRDFRARWTREAEEIAPRRALY